MVESSSKAGQQRVVGRPGYTDGQSIATKRAHTDMSEAKGQRVSRIHVQGDENRANHQQAMLSRAGNPEQKKTLDYPRPWKANMKAQPSTAPTDTALPAKKTVGGYPRPWLDNPVVHPAPSCPPLKHTIKIPEEAERRAQVSKEYAEKHRKQLKSERGRTRIRKCERQPFQLPDISVPQDTDFMSIGSWHSGDTLLPGYGTGASTGCAAACVPVVDALPTHQSMTSKVTRGEKATVRQSEAAYRRQVMKAQSGNIDRDAKEVAALRREARLRYDEQLRERNCQALVRSRGTRCRSPPYRGTPSALTGSSASAASSPKLRHPAFREDQMPALKRALSHTRAAVPDMQSQKLASTRARISQSRSAGPRRVARSTQPRQRRHMTSSRRLKTAQATTTHTTNRRLAKTSPRKKVRKAASQKRVLRAKRRASEIQRVEPATAAGIVPPANPWASLLSAQEQKHVAALTEAVRALEARLTAACMPVAVQDAAKPGVQCGPSDMRNAAPMPAERGDAQLKSAAATNASTGVERGQSVEHEPGNFSCQAALSGLTAQVETKHRIQDEAMKACAATQPVRDRQRCTSNRGEHVTRSTLPESLTCQGFVDGDAIQIPTAPQASVNKKSQARSRESDAEGSEGGRLGLEDRAGMAAGTGCSVGLHAAVDSLTGVTSEVVEQPKNCTDKVQSADATGQAATPALLGQPDVMKSSSQPDRDEGTRSEAHSPCLDFRPQVSARQVEANMSAQPALLDGTTVEKVCNDVSEEFHAHSRIVCHMQAAVPPTLPPTADPDCWSRKAENTSAKAPGKTGVEEGLLGALMRTHLYAASQQLRQQQQLQSPGTSTSPATRSNHLPYSSICSKMRQPAGVCPDPFSAVQMLAAQAYVPPPPPRAPCWAVALERSFRAAAAAAAKPPPHSPQIAFPLTAAAAAAAAAAAKPRPQPPPHTPRIAVPLTRAAGEASSCSQQLAAPLLGAAAATAGNIVASALMAASPSGTLRGRQQPSFAEAAAQVPSPADTSIRESASTLMTPADGHGAPILVMPDAAYGHGTADAPVLAMLEQADGHSALLKEATETLNPSQGERIVAAPPNWEELLVSTARENALDGLLKQHAERVASASLVSSRHGDAAPDTRRERPSFRQTPAQLQHAMMQEIDRLDTMEDLRRQLWALERSRSMGEQQHACVEARLKDVAEHLRQGLSSNLAHTVEHLQSCLTAVLKSANDALPHRVSTAMQTSPDSLPNALPQSSHTRSYSNTAPSSTSHTPSHVKTSSDSAGPNSADSEFRKRPSTAPSVGSEFPTDACTQAVQRTPETRAKGMLSSELIAWFEQEALQHHMLQEAALSRERAALQASAAEKVTRMREHRQRLHCAPSEVLRLEYAERLVASQVAADLAAVDQRLQLARRNLQQQQLCWGVLHGRCMDEKGTQPVDREPGLRLEAGGSLSEGFHAGSLQERLGTQHVETEDSSAEEVHSVAAASGAAPPAQMPPHASVLPVTEHGPPALRTASLDAATCQLAAQVEAQAAAVAAREASAAKQAELRAELAALQRRAAELDRELAGAMHTAGEVHPAGALRGMGIAGHEHRGSVDSASVVVSEAPPDCNAERLFVPQQDGARKGDAVSFVDCWKAPLDTASVCSSSLSAKPEGLSDRIKATAAPEAEGSNVVSRESVPATSTRASTAPETEAFSLISSESVPATSIAASPAADSEDIQTVSYAKSLATYTAASPARESEAISVVSCESNAVTCTTASPDNKDKLAWRHGSPEIGATESIKTGDLSLLSRGSTSGTCSSAPVEIGDPGAASLGCVKATWVKASPEAKDPPIAHDSLQGRIGTEHSESSGPSMVSSTSGSVPCASATSSPGGHGTRTAPCADKPDTSATLPSQTEGSGVAQCEPTASPDVKGLRVMAHGATASSSATSSPEFGDSSMTSRGQMPGTGAPESSRVSVSSIEEKEPSSAASEDRELSNSSTPAPSSSGSVTEQHTRPSSSCSTSHSVIVTQHDASDSAIYLSSSTRSSGWDRTIVAGSSASDSTPSSSPDASTVHDTPSGSLCSSPKSIDAVPAWAEKQPVVNAWRRSGSDLGEPAGALSSGTVQTAAVHQNVDGQSQRPGGTSQAEQFALSPEQIHAATRQQISEGQTLDSAVCVSEAQMAVSYEKAQPAASAQISASQSPGSEVQTDLRAVESSGYVCSRASSEEGSSALAAQSRQTVSDEACSGRDIADGQERPVGVDDGSGTDACSAMGAALMGDEEAKAASLLSPADDVRARSMEAASTGAEAVSAIPLVVSACSTMGAAFTGGEEAKVASLLSPADDVRAGSMEAESTGGEAVSTTPIVSRADDVRAGSTEAGCLENVETGTHALLKPTVETAVTMEAPSEGEANIHAHARSAVGAAVTVETASSEGEAAATNRCGTAAPLQIDAPVRQAAGSGSDQTAALVQGAYARAEPSESVVRSPGATGALVHDAHSQAEPSNSVLGSPGAVSEAPEPQPGPLLCASGHEEPLEHAQPDALGASCTEDDASSVDSSSEGLSSELAETSRGSHDRAEPSSQGLHGLGTVPGLPNQAGLLSSEDGHRAVSQVPQPPVPVSSANRDCVASPEPRYGSVPGPVISEGGVSGFSHKEGLSAAAPPPAAGHHTASDPVHDYAESTAPVPTGTQPGTDSLCEPGLGSTTPVVTRSVDALQLGFTTSPKPPETAECSGGPDAHGSLGAPEDSEVSEHPETSEALEPIEPGTQRGRVSAKACMDTGAVPPECKQAEGQAPAVQGQMMEHAVQGIVQAARAALVREAIVEVKKDMREALTCDSSAPVPILCDSSAPVPILCGPSDSSSEGSFRAAAVEMAPLISDCQAKAEAVHSFRGRAENEVAMASMQRCASKQASVPTCSNQPGTSLDCATATAAEAPNSPQLARAAAEATGELQPEQGTAGPAHPCGQTVDELPEISPLAPAVPSCATTAADAKAFVAYTAPLGGATGGAAASECIEASAASVHRDRSNLDGSCCIAMAPIANEALPLPAAHLPAVSSSSDVAVAAEDVSLSFGADDSSAAFAVAVGHSETPSTSSEASSTVGVPPAAVRLPEAAATSAASSTVGVPPAAVRLPEAAATSAASGAVGLPPVATGAPGAASTSGAASSAVGLPEAASPSSAASSVAEEAEARGAEALAPTEAEEEAWIGLELSEEDAKLVVDEDDDAEIVCDELWESGMDSNMMVVSALAEQDSKQVRWLQELRMEEERLFISEFAGAAMDAILAGRPPTIEFGESLLSEEKARQLQEIVWARLQQGNRIRTTEEPAPDSALLVTCVLNEYMRNHYLALNRIELEPGTYFLPLPVPKPFPPHAELKAKACMMIQGLASKPLAFDGPPLADRTDVDDYISSCLRQQFDLENAPISQVVMHGRIVADMEGRIWDKLVKETVHWVCEMDAQVA